MAGRGVNDVVFDLAGTTFLTVRRLAVAAFLSGEVIAVVSGSGHGETAKAREDASLKMLVSRSGRGRGRRPMFMGAVATGGAIFVGLVAFSRTSVSGETIGLAGIACGRSLGTSGGRIVTTGRRRGLR